MTDLTANDRRVIVERGRGWEKARPSTLAAIFATSRQNIVSILKDSCATCGEFICDHTDAEWEPASTSKTSNGSEAAHGCAADGREGPIPFGPSPARPNQSRAAGLAGEDHRAGAL